jgi:flap endonuclease-1
MHADEEGLVQFLVHEKLFNEDRVRKAVKRVLDNKNKAGQSRLESFFQVR